MTFSQFLGLCIPGLFAAVWWWRWMKKNAAGTPPSTPGRLGWPEGPAGDFGLRLERWLRRQVTIGGERVFLAEIGRWPKVYRFEDGTYLVKFRHYSPAGQKNATNLWVCGAAVVALWLIGQVQQLPPPDVLMATDPARGWAMICGAAFVVFGGRLMRLLDPLLMPPTKIWFDKTGLIEWKTNERMWFGWGPYRMGRVYPGEPWQMRVTEHRKAAAELRRAIERDRQKKRRKRMYYQQAAEVLVDVGPRRVHGLQVAEISFDEHGEKGRQVAEAIIVAAAAAQGGTETEQARPRGMFGS